MSAFDLLQSWLAPLLTPLNDVRQTLSQPMTIHDDAVTNFGNNVNTLLDGPDAYTGEGAKAMQELAQNYLNTEAQFAGAGTNLASRTSQAVLDLPSVPTGPTALEEVTQTSEACATQLTEATVTAGTELAGETGLDTVTEVVDVAAVAQAGLDSVTDIPAGVLTAISAGLKIATLVALGWSIFQAVQQWLTAMNRLGHFVLPPLPSFINTWGTTPPTFLSQGLTEQQQLQLADLLQKYPGVSQSDLENLLKLGYDEQSIHSILDSGSVSLLKYAQTTKFNAVRLKDILRAIELARRTITDAKKGKLKRAKNYHGRLPANLEQEILSNPDAVYVSTGRSTRFVFLKGGNIVVTEGAGSGRGSIVTSYGPSGARGTSGATILGGSPNDPGEPVTDAMITKGTIPRPGGDTIPPAIRILP